MAGIFWLGADKNVYYKNGDQVVNAGKALGVSDKGFDAERMSAEAAQIADPNPPKQAAPSNPNNAAAGGASSGTVLPDKSNDIALNQAGVAATDQQVNAGQSAVDKALSGLYGTYDSERATNETTYRQQGDTNQNNFQKNKQSALVNAAQGRQGLFGSLSSIGALNGDGIKLATRAVQQGANADLSDASDTFDDNKTQLDTALNSFRAEDERRRKDAATAAEDAKTNVRNQGSKSKQGFYQNLANDYAAMGNKGEAQRYTQMASQLFPDIAATSVPSTNLGYSAANFTPTALAEYMGNGSTVVKSTPAQGTGPGLQIPGLTASLKKKQQQTV